MPTPGERPLLRPDAVHLFAGGASRSPSGPRAADTLEADGYERWADAQPAPDLAANRSETPSATLLRRSPHLTSPRTEPGELPWLTE